MPLKSERDDGRTEKEGCLGCTATMLAMKNNYFRYANPKQRPQASSFASSAGMDLVITNGKILRVRTISYDMLPIISYSALVVLSSSHSYNRDKTMTPHHFLTHNLDSTVISTISMTTSMPFIEPINQTSNKRKTKNINI